MVQLPRRCTRARIFSYTLHSSAALLAACPFCGHLNGTVLVTHKVISHVERASPGPVAMKGMYKAVRETICQAVARLGRRQGRQVLCAQSVVVTSADVISRGAMTRGGDERGRDTQVTQQWPGDGQDSFMACRHLCYVQPTSKSAVSGAEGQSHRVRVHCLGPTPSRARAALGSAHTPFPKARSAQHMYRAC
jgi:hypothetical protein